MFKEEIRIVGFDDGPFDKNSKSVPVVGAVYRGGKFIDGVLKTEVKVDGLDSTKKLIKLINSSRQKKQLKVIMLDGITFGGFNLVDIKELNEKTGLPAIVINRKLPNLKEIKSALKNFRDFEKRWKIVKNAGKINSLKIREKEIFYQCKGLDDEEACEIISLSSTHSFIPEPLRVAHLIARAIVKGESFGRA